MQQYACRDGTEWKLCHSFFANMGGFVGIIGPPFTIQAESDVDNEKKVPAPLMLISFPLSWIA